MILVDDYTLEYILKRALLNCAISFIIVLQASSTRTAVHWCHREEGVEAVPSDERYSLRKGDGARR